MTKLPYKVECQSSYPFYEVIAAFDCESAAVNYARECAADNPTYNYRVRFGHRMRLVTPMLVGA
jgi:hypothetical protein